VYRITIVLKSLLFLAGWIILSRFVGFADNFSPMLAFAVFIPRLTSDPRIQYFLPIFILFFSNLFLNKVSYEIFIAMLLVYALAPRISKLCKNLFLGTSCALFLWHILVNGAVWITYGGSLFKTYLNAIPFDFKFAISTALFVSLFYLAEVLMKMLSFKNIKS